MGINRGELADFLRRVRERTAPEDAGLKAGPRRRIPGLRREEVAQLAGISVDYYIRIEQGRGPQPSPQVLAALARALFLDRDERDHLHLLAGHQPLTDPAVGTSVEPGIRHLLDHLPGTPVQVLNGLGDVLAQNALAENLLGGVCTVSEHGRNVVWRWFTDPAVRAPYPPDEHQHYSRVHVADLRAAAARHGGDAATARLLDRLTEASAEFAELWQRHEVAVRRRNRMRVLHPQAGLIELDCQVLLAPSGDQRVVLLSPPPGSPAAVQLLTLT